MAAPLFNKRYGVEQKAFVEGLRPGDNARLGPNPGPITDPKDFANQFISLKFNPDSKSMWQTSTFGADTAEASQQKLNQAGTTDLPPNADQFVKDFAYKYSGPGGAIERGLVSPENAVTKERLASLITESATAGSSEKDPNTANKFPNQGVGIG